MIDPELHEAWDNKHESPEAMRWCRRCVRHAMERLYKAAKHVPDPHATADKGAIVAAMTRGNRGPVYETPPDLSNMCDPEFREYTRKLGFEAGI
jgi:hypothetical protein